jgi:hypothetical protein
MTMELWQYVWSVTADRIYSGLSFCDFIEQGKIINLLRFR